MKKELLKELKDTCLSQSTKHVVADAIESEDYQFAGEVLRSSLENQYDFEVDALYAKLPQNRMTIETVITNQL